MYGLSIYEIKRICHYTHFFNNLTWKFSAFYNFSEKIQVLNIKLIHLLSPSSFLILILIISHYLKLSRKCENVFVFPSMSRYCMIYFGYSPIKGFIFLEQIIYKKSDIKNLIYCYYFMDYHLTFKKKEKMGSPD